MNILKIQTLAKGWHDKDAILLHAAFQVLMDFVERERPEAVTDWNATKDHKQAWREIRSLYTWWKQKRPARRSPLDDKKLVRPRLSLRRIPDSESPELVRPSPEKYAAYYRALKAHSRLEEKLKFDEWRAGTRSNDDMSQAIHAFHQGPSRDTFKTYNELYSPLDMAVVHAIVTGILDEAEIEGDLLEHLAPVIQFYHEGG